MNSSRHLWPAAFFDLDGTLLPEPSLERRLLRFLRERGEWSPLALGRWAARFLMDIALDGKAPRGETLLQAIHGNKLYWKSIPASCTEKFFAERALPEFFPEALLRIAWHAAQGQKIFLVTGTPHPLAEHIAGELRSRVRGAWTGLAGVCATRLKERNGRWTGEILGDAVCGSCKAHAVERLAREHELDLARSFAYGNSAADRAMLACVGNPVTVNPSRALRRIARAVGWPMLFWGKIRVEARRGAQSQSEKENEFVSDGVVDWQKALEKKA
ncbi:MAG TPA: HAD-IB family hydrolase [Candidatus Acidoferrales bacterium]|nr:HAD-IB family hydrolase [Candidatus Acidoferrales bacterium]